MGGLFVYYNDRVCPLETMTRDYCLKVYGKAHWKDFSAVQVVTGWYFFPEMWDNIPVKVRKNGVWYPINADQGKAPGKIAVGTDYNPWCDERVDIDFWWQNNNKQGLFYLYTQSPATLTKFWYKQATYRNGEPISK